MLSELSLAVSLSTCKSGEHTEGSVRAFFLYALFFLIAKVTFLGLGLREFGKKSIPKLSTERFIHKSSSRFRWLLNDMVVLLCL